MVMVNDLYKHPYIEQLLSKNQSNTSHSPCCACIFKMIWHEYCKKWLSASHPEIQTNIKHFTASINIVLHNKMPVSGYTQSDNRTI
jgi:hypothetical protein